MDGMKHSLVELVLNQCSSITEIPASHSMWRLGVLETLTMEGGRLAAVPAAIGQLTSLQTLRLCRQSELARLPEAVGKLEQLKTLELSSCDRLVVLPAALNPKQLPQLTKLRLDYCLRLDLKPKSPYQLVVEAFKSNGADVSVYQLSEQQKTRALELDAKRGL
jgi:Leucine-rich repeat (LRR) protein